METPTLSLLTSGVLSVWEALQEVESLQQWPGFKSAHGGFTHCWRQKIGEKCWMLLLIEGLYSLMFYAKRMRGKRFWSHFPRWMEPGNDSCYRKAPDPNQMAKCQCGYLFVLILIHCKRVWKYAPCTQAQFKDTSSIISPCLCENQWTKQKLQSNSMTLVCDRSFLLERIIHQAQDK